MAQTMCLSGAAIFKAGANVSTDLAEADYDFAIEYFYCVDYLVGGKR